MDREGKFWATIAGMAFLLVALITVCATISGSRSHKEEMARIEHGCQPTPQERPLVNPAYRHDENMELLKHGCPTVEQMCKP